MYVTEFSAVDILDLRIREDNLRVLRAYHKNGKIVEVQFGLLTELKKYSIDNIVWKSLEKVEVYRYFYQNDGPFKKGFYLEYKDFAAELKKLQKDFIKMAKPEKKSQRQISISNFLSFPGYDGSKIVVKIGKKLNHFQGEYQIIGKRTEAKFELKEAEIIVVKRSLEELVALAQELGANIICKGLHREGKGFYYFARANPESLEPDFKIFLLENMKK